MDLVPCATGEVWDLNRGVAVLHLPTLALPNATFGYSKSSELSRIRHGAALEPLRESDDDSAVNREDGTGDVRGHVAGQEEERVGDLIRHLPCR